MLNIFNNRHDSASSTKRGNAFEKRAFQAIKRELKNDWLGLSPRASRPFMKKGYYSRDRDKDIIVDISIEVWLRSADHWSMLWVGECKDYSGSVPVDDVEEFKAKLDQITGANKKGVMIISGALQESALKYATANGIGVIRLSPEDQIEHLRFRKTLETNDAGSSRIQELIGADSDLIQQVFEQALTSAEFRAPDQSIIAVWEGEYFHSWRSFLNASLIGL